MEIFIIRINDVLMAALGEVGRVEIDDSSRTIQEDLEQTPRIDLLNACVYESFRNGVGWWMVMLAVRPSTLKSVTRTAISSSLGGA